MTAFLRELAALAHRHKLVPFLGAGCSVAHLGLDWDSITASMASQLSVQPPPALSNQAIAQMFVDEHGVSALAELLRRRLLVDVFDDARGTIPLQVLSLELRSVYTTNQDNVYERAAEKFGRPVVSVATLAELDGTKPGDRVLYKFHGSLGSPETLIFTEQQYAARMAEDWHFLNVRLRSDLLSKRFLFVGYSFRDPNIQELFAQMQAQFPDALPGSYLLAYRWSAELDTLCTSHGVTCVDPARHLDAPVGEPGADLEAFLAKLCELTLGLCTQDELDAMFKPKTPTPRRVAIKGQLEAVKQAAFAGPPERALAAFRGACDLAVLPDSVHGLVEAALVEIIRKAPVNLIGDVSGALFNLRLPLERMLEPVAAFMALANRLPEDGGSLLNLHIPPGNVWPGEVTPGHRGPSTRAARRVGGSR